METVRLGNHELLIRLATGGAANVFLVRDREHDNRLLALKILLPSLAQNDDFLNMFFTEAKIASHLRHPNIVAIAGFGQVEGIHCLAMEYVFGASLSQVLRASARAKKPLTVGVLLRLTASVCDALHYAHELTDKNGESMGLVHRDVTPQNILIGFNGVPKLTDFGIAKATNRGWETQAGIVKGKFSYMSPEQALGKAVDRRSDIFGAGIVLWEALTGRDLFKGSTPMEVLTAIREHRIEPPSKVVPGLTPIVDPIVMRALRRSPRHRYATAADMRDEIEELIQRAGVKIDAETISHEFAQIYGDEIGKRALALRQAMVGSADLENLAQALGGSVLNPKQLPAIKGGVTDPDPLGLFSAQAADHISDEVSGSMPARIERSFSGRPEAVEDFEIIDDDEDDDLLDMQEGSDHFVAEAPEVPSNRMVTGWDDSTSTSIPEDELLAMISEEDATIGFLPPQFAKRFGQVLQDALNHGRIHYEDERTVGVPDSTLSPLRALSSEDSISDAEPPVMLRPMAAELASRSPRPVPRAPSVLMEEEQARLKERNEPRAPSWDMESNASSSDPSAGHVDRSSRPQPGRQAPAPPSGAASVRSGGSAVILRDESAANGRSAGAADQSPRRPPPVPLGELDDAGSKTDRAAAPMPFGTYSFTRASKKGWSAATSAKLPNPDHVPHPPAERSEPPAEWAPGPEAEVSGELPPVDWAEPSPEPHSMTKPLPELELAPPRPPKAVGPKSEGSEAKRSISSPSPVKPPVQLSVTMLLLLGAVLLAAGAGIGLFLGPQLWGS